MKLSEWFESLRAHDLDPGSMGSWPAVVKVTTGLLLMVLLLALGYHFCLKDAQARLVRERGQEAVLKAQFASKVQLAASLELYLEQVSEVESALAILLRQLPGDSELPGLLEDITHAGLDGGLAFEKIEWLAPVAQAFYVELPIQISVTGTYHELGRFVSGLAGLSRIVTLHDFAIEPLTLQNGSRLRMSLLAKTYRDNGQGPGQ